MLSKIFLASAGVMLAAAEGEFLNSCLAGVADDTELNLTWDLTSLEGTTNYVEQTGANSPFHAKWEWNYCTPVSEGSYATYTTYADSDKLSVNEAKVFASSDTFESETLTRTLSDGTKEAIGVRLTQQGDACSDGTTRQFITDIYCANSPEGAELIVSPLYVPPSDKYCTATVRYQGTAGCATEVTPDPDPTPSGGDGPDMAWIRENPWVYGIFFMVGGVFVALYGLSMFPYVAATVAALGTIMAALNLFALFGWLDSTTGLVLSSLGALALAIGVGCLVRRAIWVMVGLLGAYGAVVLTFLTLFFATGGTCGSGLSEWAPWILPTICVVTGIAGFVAGCKLGGATVLVLTSFLGSYWVVAGLASFFWTDHWPSYMMVYDGVSDFTADTSSYEFYVFLSIMIVMGIGAAVFQTKMTKKHKDLEDLDNYEQL